MRISTAAGVAGVATAALAFSMFGVNAGAAAAADKAIGLTSSGGMVSFSVDNPAKLTTIGKPTGLAGDSKLIGIDYRVQDGKLYGVGDQGGVYTLDGTAATKVSQLSVTLSGTTFDIDFNPAADRLRIISDTGQNLRHDVNSATPTTANDGTLTYTPPAAAGSSPPPITPATGVVGAAYTNNDLDASTATSIFDIDTAMDQVAIQSPANSGILVNTGKLGVDAGSDAGFDIVSTLTAGKTTNNVGYATLSVGEAYGLYRIIPLTGEAKKIGDFPAARQVTDIALQPK